MTARGPQGRRGRLARGCALACAVAGVVAGALAGCSREERPAATPAPAPAPAPAVAPSPPVTAPSPPKRPPPPPPSLTRVTIKALGMYCEESCPVQVRFALAAVPSVYELGFDLSKESIFVSYDASLGTPKEVTRPMIAAIKRAGFDPWLAKESWPDGVTARVIER